MKAEELMLGDWVYQAQYEDATKPYTGHGWKPVKVTSLPFDKDYFIEPIPLTPEILEMNGFKLKEESGTYSEFVCVYEHSIISFVFYKETIYKVNTLLDCELGLVGGLNRIHHCLIKYVHELQHALRMCGIDKEIKMEDEEE